MGLRIRLQSGAPSPLACSWIPAFDRLPFGATRPLRWPRYTRSFARSTPARPSSRPASCCRSFCKALRAQKPKRRFYVASPQYRYSHRIVTTTSKPRIYAIAAAVPVYKSRRSMRSSRSCAFVMTSQCFRRTTILCSLRPIPSCARGARPLSYYVTVAAPVTAAASCLSVSASMARSAAGSTGLCRSAKPPASA